MTAPRILQVGEELPPMEFDSPLNAGKASKAKGKNSSRGRFKCINDFCDGALAGLGRAELATWFLLWRDTKPIGLARTPQSDLARRAGCDPRTIRRALVKLVKYGLVRVVRRGGLPLRLSIYRVYSSTH